MSEILPSLFVVIASSLIVGLAIRPFSRRERGLLGLSFAMHGFAALGQVWITRDYYGGGDMMNYFQTGSAIADVVAYRPSMFMPELWALLVHGDSQWPFYVMGAGGSTGTMSAVSGLLQMVFGKSIYACCLTLSFVAFFGQLALYKVFRDVFASPLWPRLLIATMLIPSVVFWSSGILKETVAMAAFGWTVFGLHRFVQDKRAVGLAIILFAGFWVSLVKAYILFALAVAGGVWWYWSRTISSGGGRPVTIRPVYLVLGTAAVVGMIVGLGELFPRYAMDRLGEETGRLQRVGADVGGGSYYEVTDTLELSVAGQLAFAPIALLTSLFRPLVFEVRNLTMAINALETAVLTVLFAQSIAKKGVGELWLMLRRSPSLMFALVFVAGFGVAVGLASTNLGTLSRYRIPLVPFFAALVLIGSAPERLFRTVAVPDLTSRYLVPTAAKRASSAP